MINLKHLTLALLLCLFATAQARRPMGKIIKKGLSVSRTQSLIMAKSLESQQGRFPRSFEKGKLITSDYRWWCSGKSEVDVPLTYADYYYVEALIRMKKLLADQSKRL